MIKEYQVTLVCNSKTYKPISCIIKCEELDLSNSTVKKELIKKGTIKMCQKRLWGGKDLAKFGYTKAMIREYDKIKIEAEASARYEAIKEAKYSSGEWKHPKSKE